MERSIASPTSFVRRYEAVSGDEVIKIQLSLTLHAAIQFHRVPAMYVGALKTLPQRSNPAGPQNALTPIS